MFIIYCKTYNCLKIRKWAQPKELKLYFKSTMSRTPVLGCLFFSFLRIRLFCDENLYQWNLLYNKNNEELKQNFSLKMKMYVTELKEVIANYCEDIVLLIW